MIKNGTKRICKNVINEKPYKQQILYDMFLRPSLHFTTFHFTTLHYTSLHFTTLDDTSIPLV